MIIKDFLIRLIFVSTIILLTLGFKEKSSQAQEPLEAKCCVYEFVTVSKNSYTISDPITCRDLWFQCLSHDPDCPPVNPDNVICPGSSITINKTVTHTEYWYSAANINVDCDVLSPGSGWVNLGVARRGAYRPKYSVKTEPFSDPDCSGILQFNFSNCSRSDFEGCFKENCSRRLYPPGSNGPVPECVIETYCRELKKGDDFYYGPLIRCN